MKLEIKMSIIIDSSVWIEYFRNGKNYEKADFLIEENLVVTNELILTELSPFLKLKKQHKLIKLLNNINNATMPIVLEQLIEFQYKCIKNGLNEIGIQIKLNAKIGQNYDFVTTSMGLRFFI